MSDERPYILAHIVVNGEVREMKITDKAFDDYVLERAIAQHIIAERQAELREEAERKLTANEILEKYYRRRARNPKLKLSNYLRDIGEGAREGYIRKVKVAYDKRHRHKHKR